MLTEPLLLAVPPSAQPWLQAELNDIIHQRDQKETVPFRLLEDAAFIMLKEGYGFRQVVTELCYHHGFQPKITFETSHIQTAQALVKKWARCDSGAENGGTRGEERSHLFEN
ncbi:LysR substrate-binding domain-containing protein [Bacillus sp. SL00103]